MRADPKGRAAIQSTFGNTRWVYNTVHTYQVGPIMMSQQYLQKETSVFPNRLAPSKNRESRLSQKGRFLSLTASGFYAYGHPMYYYVLRCTSAIL